MEIWSSLKEPNGIEGRRGDLASRPTIINEENEKKRQTAAFIHHLSV